MALAFGEIPLTGIRTYMRYIAFFFKVPVYVPHQGI